MRNTKRILFITLLLLSVSVALLPKADAYTMLYHDYAIDQSAKYDSGATPYAFVIFDTLNDILSLAVIGVYPPPTYHAAWAICKQTEFWQVNYIMKFKCIIAYDPSKGTSQNFTVNFRLHDWHFGGPDSIFMVDNAMDVLFDLKNSGADYCTFLRKIVDGVPTILDSSPYAPLSGQLFFLEIRGDGPRVEVRVGVTPDAMFLILVTDNAYSNKGTFAYSLADSLQDAATPIQHCTISDYTLIESTGVGGVVIPMNKLALIAPCIGLTAIALGTGLATTVYIKHQKHKQ